MRILKYLKKMFLFVLKEAFATVIFLMVFAAIIISLSLTFLNKKEKVVIIKDNSYLYLSLPKGLNDINNFDINIFNKTKSFTLFDVLKTIEYASYDKKIDGIVLDLDNMYLTFSQIEELGKELKEFKETGKKIIAFSYSVNKNNFLLGSIANKFYMDPSASTDFSLEGFKVSVPYTKSITDMVGVEFQVIHIGDYKTYGENYVKSGMSKEFRSSYEKILVNRLDYFVKTISENRKIDKKSFENSFLNGDFLMLNSKEALQNKLIDERVSMDDLENKKIIKNKVELSEYYESIKLPSRKNKIALIVAEGDISMSSDLNNGITPSYIETQLEKIKDDSDIKGLILRVNSPGGSALASEIIYQKLKEMKKKIPIYVSMGDMAASGGYYISSIGNKIFANENTVTGSIGVVTMSFNLKNLYDKLGINYQTVELGKSLDFSDLSKKASQSEIKLIQKSMVSTYDEFKSHVAEGRKMSDEKVESLAKGQIYSGTQAKEVGLVDSIGGLSDTIGAFAKDYKLSDYEVVFYEKDFNKLNELLDIKKYIKEPKLIEKLKEIDETMNFVSEINNKPSVYFPYNKEN